jgi:peroxiredoxin
MTPVCAFGRKAPQFRLPATDGRPYGLADIAGPRGTLVMFLCNHCPYVKAALPRILRDARAVQALGIGVVAICSNDAAACAEDSFAAREEFPFPYLHDEDQRIAHAFGATCTPEFFGYDAQGGLQYHGRLDAAGRGPGHPDMRRDLYEAMAAVARTGHGPAHQVPSVGCAIKWKTVR